MQAILAILIIVAYGNLDLVLAQECQECQADNAVYCHNQTSYQNCMKGKPFGDVELCASGTVCTNDLDVCVANPDGTTTKDVCGTDSECGSCVGSPKYTCVSSTQFARCKGTALISSTIYSCDVGELCYKDGYDIYGTICAPSCALDFIGAKATCTNDEFTTTTTTEAPPTTPSEAAVQGICDAAAPGTTAAPETSSGESTSTTASPVTKFFYTKNTGDNTCRTYVYCQKSATNSSWTTVFLTCSATKPYFDSATKGCVATKPTDCS